MIVDLGRNPVLAWVAGGDGGGHAEVQLPEQSGQQVVLGPSRSIYLCDGKYMLVHICWYIYMYYVCIKEYLTILPTGGNGATLVFGAGRGIQTMQVFQTPSNINGNQHYLFHTFYLSKVRSASGGVSSLHLPALPRELSGQGQSSFNVYPLQVHRCCEEKK